MVGDGRGSEAVSASSCTNCSKDCIVDDRAPWIEEPVDRRFAGLVGLREPLNVLVRGRYVRMADVGRPMGPRAGWASSCTHGDAFPSNARTAAPCDAHTTRPPCGSRVPPATRTPRDALIPPSRRTRRPGIRQAPTVQGFFGAFSPPAAQGVARDLRSFIVRVC